MKTAVFSLVALTCSCANAFTFSPISLRNARPQANTRSSSSSLSMALKEDSFIPSETWLGEYMGEQGLRYALNKTPEEVEKEGDYTLLEKLFGQTSNNKKRMDLKKEVLAKANTPTNPSLYKEWTAKYGYGRFFPVYVDKSGLDSETRPDEPARPNRTAAAPKPQAFAKIASKVTKSQPAKAVKAQPTVKAAVRKAQAAPKVAAKVVSQAEKKVVAKVKPVVAKAKPVVKKAVGNLKNLPKAL